MTTADLSIDVEDPDRVDQETLRLLQELQALPDGASAQLIRSLTEQVEFTTTLLQSAAQRASDQPTYGQWGQYLATAAIVGILPRRSEQTVS